jgi:ADP-heptose:LPS heptosyltransferase
MLFRDKDCLTYHEFTDWVVFFANGYGDSVIARPMLGAVKDCFQRRKATVTFVGQIGSHSFLSEDLGFDRVVFTQMNWNGTNGRQFDVEAVLSQVSNTRGFVAAVPWTSSSLRELRHQLNPEISIGYFSEYDVCVPIDSSINNVEMTYRLARALDSALPLRPNPLPPTFSLDVERWTHELISLVPRGFRVLVVHADSLPEKEWPERAWRAMLERFIRRHSNFVILLVGHRNIGLHLDRYPNHLIPLMGLSLEASMCVVSKADLFAGIDSCMLHVADAFGVPSLGIFLVTNPEEWGLYWSSHVHIQITAKHQPIKACAEALSRLAGLRTGGLGRVDKFDPISRRCKI